MDIVDRGLDEVLDSLPASWPVGSTAVAVVDATGTSLRGGGIAYPWASVTKVVTALTVLDAAADGVVDLDEPVGPPGSTLRHLLAHASGSAPEGGPPAAAVGARRIYSNSGYELAADHLARAAGRAFGDELSERVLQPLGMSATALTGSAAHGLSGPIEDVARLASELLAPSVLQPAIVDQVSTIAYPGLSGVLPGSGRQEPCVWGLGCEIRGRKDPHWTASENSPRTFGHFGRSGSFLWVDREAGVACASLADTPFGPWAVQAWPVLSSAWLTATGPVRRAT